MKKIHQVEFPEYYGDFGGIFVPDSFTPDLDQLAQRASEIIPSDTFKMKFELVLKKLDISKIKINKLDIKAGYRIYHTCSQSEYYAIAGQTALGSELKAELMICGAEAEGPARAFAEAIQVLDTKGLIYLNQEMAKNEELVAQLKASCEVDVRTCQELFDVPQMYAFQKYMENRKCRHFVPVEANVGPYPFPAIVGHFANVYGKKLIASLKEVPASCIIPIKTGSNAIGVVNALANYKCHIATVEEPVAQESHGAFCGNLTLFTKMAAGQNDNRAICPELANWWRKGRVMRLGCDHPGLVETNMLTETGLSFDVSRAIILAIKEFGCKDILVVEESL